MEFTGSELILKRNFYTQTGSYGFNMICTVDNTTGRYFFGVTGNNIGLEFKLESGKIYYGDTFIHSYKSFDEFSIDANFTSGKNNILKDQIPLIYNGNKSTGYFDYFYFKRENASLGASFDVNISGDSSPSYQIQTIGYLISSGQNAVTGYFVNQSSFPLRIFDCSIQASQNYDFGKLVKSLSSNTSGFFAYSGDFNVIDVTQPIMTTFNTNYNDINIIFTIIDATSLSKFVLFQDIANYDFNSSGILNRDLFYTNFSGGFLATSFNTNLYVSLGYISGSGAAIDYNQNYNVLGHGNFANIGTITGGLQTLTGIQVLTLDGVPATGRASGLFTGLATGMASGNHYTGLAIGYISGYATGMSVFGTVNILSQNITGTPLSGFSIFGTGAVSGSTGYLDLSSPDDFTITNSPYVFHASEGGAVLCQGLLGVDYNMIYNSSPLDLQGIVQCLSGFNQLGVYGVVRNSTIIDFYSKSVGALTNSILIQSVANLPGTGYFTGGSNGIGPTGLTVYPIGPFTGNFIGTITGSGDYYYNFTGSGLYIEKTFTGSWDLLTGFTVNSLASVKNSNDTDTLIFNTGTLPPNSFINFQVNHLSNLPDTAYLLISGNDVINPITRILTI